MADKEITLDRQAPAEEKKPVEKNAKKKDADGATLPVLVEFTVTVCVIFLVLVFFTIVGVSLFTGATLLDFVIRTSVSLLVIGSLLTLIARQISSGMLKVGANTEEKTGEKLPDESMKSTSEVT